MSPETLFSICNVGVIPAWGLLAVAPGWAWTQRIVHAVWIPLLLGAAYAAALATGQPPEGASFGSLSGVMAFFTDPWSATAAWIHFVVFDLFVGAWEVRDAQRRDVPHLAVVPCLLFTLMLGPVGLGLYLLVRLVRARTTTLLEA